MTAVVVSCSAGSREIWMSLELWVDVGWVGKIFLCSRSSQVASLFPFNNIHLTPSFCMHVPSSTTHESRKSKEDCLFWVVVTLFWTQWITMMMMIEIENHYPFSNFLLLFKSIYPIDFQTSRPAFLANAVPQSAKFCHSLRMATVAIEVCFDKDKEFLLQLHRNSILLMQSSSGLLPFVLAKPVTTTINQFSPAIFKDSWWYKNQHVSLTIKWHWEPISKWKEETIEIGHKCCWLPKLAVQSKVSFRFYHIFVNIVDLKFLPILWTTIRSLDR